MSKEISIGLAPMEGVTDFATRLWFAKTSAPEFCWTPFHRATASSTGQLPVEYVPELQDLKSYIPYKLIPQVMTGEPDQFCKVAEEILKICDYVDLNCGCPSSTVVGRGSGSSVLETTDKFSNLVSKISTRLGVEKLSVKMRLGFHDPKEMNRLVQSIQEFKLRHLTVHGRTRPQKYTGKADWQMISDASKMCEFPVVGSGDIFSRKTYDDSTEKAPHVKIRIIGRGAVRNPWVFDEIRNSKPVKITFNTLVFAITSFANIQKIYRIDLEKLFTFSKEGLFLEPCGTDENLWQIFFEKISAQSLENVELTTYGLARLKMLWNHLRTSLPERFWSPNPLRCKNFSEFLFCLRDIQHGYEEEFLLEHKPEWNWLFSGEKSGN